MELTFSFYVRFVDYLEANRKFLLGYCGTDVLGYLMYMEGVITSLGNYNHENGNVKIDLSALTIVYETEDKIIGKIIESIAHETLHYVFTEVVYVAVLSQDSIIYPLIKYLGLEILKGSDFGYEWIKIKRKTYLDKDKDKKLVKDLRI